MKLLSRVWLFVIPWTMPTKLLHPWNFPGKNTGMGCHSLLWGIFPTQRLNLGHLHCRQMLYRLSHQGSKHKERILKAAREKQQVTYKGNPICLTADLSAETLQARREWQDIFKEQKGKNLQPRLLYLARISFNINGEIKSFSDKQKLREFSTTKPALQQVINRLI